MPLDKMQYNDATKNRRHRISIYSTAKTLVHLMEPMESNGRDFIRKAFSDKWLLATNMVIAFVLCTLADIIEQHIEFYMSGDNVVGDGAPAENKLDLIRVRNMGLSGCVVEFICHYWYQFLDRRMPERTLSVVFKKIALDQLICAPIYLTAFFIMLGILDGESAEQIWIDVKSKALRVYMAEWIVWPPAQFVNFYFVSPKYRVAYDSFISFGYDIYTSRVKHFEDDADASSVLMSKIQRSLLSGNDT